MACRTCPILAGLVIALLVPATPVAADASDCVRVSLSPPGVAVDPWECIRDLPPPPMPSAPTSDAPTAALP